MTSPIDSKELYRIVTTAIIYKDGKFLIVKRALDKKVWPGRWTVPGGGLDPKDYANLKPDTESNAWYFILENTLRREVREETGVEIGKPEYLLDLVFVRPDNIQVLTLSFYASWKSGEVILDSENVDYKWVGIDELEDVDLIEGIPEEIIMVSKILNGGSREDHL